MTDPLFPYYKVPQEARWREVMAGRLPQHIDPHLNTSLRIEAHDKIASAGSCFAQRIAEALKNANYNYLCEEEGSPFITAQERTRRGYGLYSARYGNIYTALQLLQLLRRAYGRFEPSEPLWRLPNGAYVDPFRPSIESGGFASESLCLWDRQAHLAAVRRVFESVDIFVFTLGLTETWCNRTSNAAFPACPGSSLGGRFDEQQYQFHNFGVTEVNEHMEAFIKEFREINPTAQIVLTVSPVPLLATYEERHVLQANIYSKSVLRVVAEELIRLHQHVHYFASYEIVNASGDSRAYFLDDLRTVSEAAVEHVISCFHRQFTSYVIEPNTKQANITAITNQPLCDEDLVMATLADQVQAERT